MATKCFKAYANKVVCSSEKKRRAKTTNLFSESTQKTQEHVGNTTDGFGDTTTAKLLTHICKEVVKVWRTMGDRRALWFPQTKLT